MWSNFRSGLYVYLDLKWFEHPFAFNNFRIKDEEQIATIRGLGLRKVRFRSGAQRQQAIAARRGEAE